MEWILLLLTFGIVFLLVLLLGVYDRYRIRRPALRALELYERGDYEGALPILERVVKVTPWTSPPLTGVYLALGHLYSWQREHERAIAQFEEVLRVNARLRIRMPDLVFADLHAYLSFNYDAVGNHEAAAAARRQALSLMSGELTGVGDLLIRGRLLHNEWRYREAASDFTRALESGVEMEPELRLDTCWRVALASDACGRPEDTLRFAREGLALGLTSDAAQFCAELAGSAARSLMHPEEAMGYFRRAYELAMAKQNTESAADTLVKIGGIARDAGRLDEYLARIREAEACSLEPDARRSVLWARFDYLGLMGQFDEAREVLRHGMALDAPLAQDPRQLDHGSSLYYLARLETAAGDPKAARAALNEAKAILQGHERYGIKCRYLSACIAALAGETERAQAEISPLEEMLPALEADRGTFLTAVIDLGEACYHLGDYDRTIALLQQCPVERWPSVMRPAYWYCLGECHRGLGNLPAAREWYAKAAHIGFETYYTRLAVERLTKTEG
ncbi:MAG: tetratricopeptide repeat protein [Armatimonadota bacterium]